MVQYAGLPTFPEAFLRLKAQQQVENRAGKAQHGDNMFAAIRQIEMAIVCQQQEAVAYALATAA